MDSQLEGVGDIQQGVQHHSWPYHVFGIVMEHNVHRTFLNTPCLKPVIEHTCYGLASMRSTKLLGMEDDSLTHWADPASPNVSREAEVQLWQHSVCYVMTAGIT